MKNIVEYILFLGFGLVVKLAGLNLSRRLTFLLAYLFYYFIPIRRKTVISNLRLAFPDIDKKKIYKTGFDCYRNFLITLVEILYMTNMSRSEIIDAVDISNPELIVQKFNQGKGVILLSAHFGNWEYIAASVSARVNIPFHVVVKPLRNPYVNNWMNNARTKWNNKVIPLGISMRQVYKELKNKNLVAMVSDQRGPFEGIRVIFFGIQTASFSGPAALALKTGAPILFGASVRQPDFNYKVVLEEISTDNLPENEEEKIIEITQRHTNVLERYIRQYPSQWFWMHKRWKY